MKLMDSWDIIVKWEQDGDKHCHVFKALNYGDHVDEFLKIREIWDFWKSNNLIKKHFPDFLSFLEVMAHQFLFFSDEYYLPSISLS